MPPEQPGNADLDRMARDWMVRVQLGDASGPGETDEARAKSLAAFEAWRLADPAHAAAVERMKAAADTTRILPTGLMFATSRLKRASFRERHPAITAALAACLVAATGMGLYISSHPAAAVGPGVSVPGADALYVTMVGETQDIKLPDGTTVLLDADSQLRVQYTASARNLRLDRGRARFTVAHESRRAFAVGAGNAQVIAHGTIFDVSMSARRVHVALLRGSIEIARSGDRQEAPAERHSRFLTPGQEISFSGSAAMPLPEPTFIGGLDWVSGRSSFDNARLGDAVDEINRYNTMKIVLAEPALGDLRVSGGFEARNPEAFSDVVAKALGLHVVRQTGGQLLLTSGSSTAD